MSTFVAQIHLIFSILFCVQSFFLKFAANAEFSVLDDGFYHEIDGTAVSAGFHHTCALEMRPSLEFGGALRCWGFNDHGQASPPQGIFIQVSSGHLFSCGIKISETVECWGHVGPVPDGLFLQISAGEFHACGLTKDSDIRCWGGHSSDAVQPPSGPFVQVSSGSDYSCAIDTKGLVQCWGDGTRGKTQAPQHIQFVQVSASKFGHFACGVTLIGGDVVCWGDNRRGQSQGRTGPFTQVTAGNSLACGIRASNSSLECWGLPTRVTECTIQEWEQVTAGLEHVCAMNIDSELMCWGPSNEFGPSAVDVPMGFIVA